MFENLKQHINRENLHILKKKNRYLEDHNESDSSQDNPLDWNSANQHNLNSRKAVKPANPFKHEKKNDISSSDSLSDYELQQRQQAFNRLASQTQVQFSPLEKYKINFSDTYFTPDNKIKELQRSISLSQQKLKLTQQYHSRQITALTQKNDRKVHQLNLEIQKLQLLIKQSDSKQLRINDLTKENHSLRETLHTYEQKYWQFQQIQKLLNQTLTENKVLKLQNSNIKEQIQQVKNYSLNKQNQPANQNLPSNHQMSRSIQDLESKLKNSQRTASNLEKKLSQAIHQGGMEKLFYEQKIKSFERKFDQLEEILRSKQKQLFECQNECQKVKIQKETVEKSLLQTMESFSKHLSNESAQNQLLTRHINKSVTYSQQNSYKKQLKEYRIENQTSLNFQEATEVQNPNKKYCKSHEKNSKDLHEISPVPVKKVSFYEPSQHHERERARVMSYQVSGPTNQRKRQRNRENGNQTSWNPEKYDKDRIIRLERKLEDANQQIVKLLRQKVERGLHNNEKYY